MWRAVQPVMLSVLFLGVGTAQAQLQVQQVDGSAEGRQAGVWRPLGTGPVQATQLRTGAGRLELRWGSGSLLLNSAALAGISGGKLQLVAGQVYVTGPAQLYVRGYHLNLPPGSAARADLLARSERVAVLRGSARLAYGSRTVSLASGEQFSLVSGRPSAFQETDPWYLSRITGRGDAVIEALRGQVTVGQGRQRPAAVGQSLGEGQRLRTAANSWAELGFTGGGYLRLQADSELQVTAVQTSTRGREIWLQLNRGSAWNVVAKGQGGYRITTPVVSTAVRGTVYRVDAGGLVKVFEGEVDAGETVVQSGQQLEENRLEALQTDTQDTFNLSLDQLRALPIGLQVLTAQRTGEVVVQAAPLSDLRLEAQAHDGVVWSWPLHPQDVVRADRAEQVPSLAPVTYTLSPLGHRQAASLLEGGYTFRVVGQRYGQHAEQPLDWESSD